MQKQKFCADLVIGEDFRNEPFVLQSISGTVNGQMRVILSDRSGSVPCNIDMNMANAVGLSQHVGDVFLVTAAVMSEKRMPLIIAREVVLHEGNYLPAELHSGISQKKKEEYISLIKEVYKKISNPSHLALVQACLTDENLERQATYLLHIITMVYIWAVR